VKRKIWIMALAVMAVITLSVIGVSALQKRNQKPYISDSYTVETEVNGAQYYIDDSGKKTALTYHKSLETADGSMLRFYLDQNNNQYGYDEGGELIAFEPNQNIVNKSLFVAEGKKTDSEIEALALKYIQQIYGKNYAEKLTLSKTIYAKDVNNYDVYFDVMYYDRFVTESCIATLSADGALMDVCAFAKGRMDRLDIGALKKVDADLLRQRAEEELKKLYGKQLASFQIGENISVINDKNNYILSVTTEVDIGEGEDIYGQRINGIFDLSGEFLRLEKVE